MDLKGILESPRQRFPTALLVGAIVLTVLGGSGYLALRNRETPRASHPFPLGPNEQAYLQYLHFSELKMSRASNYLNQKVTFLSGIALNAGPRTLRNIEVTVEYRDTLDRVVLRERMGLFGTRPVPLGPGQKRRFQLGFEHIPETWNYTYPTIRVTGLQFE